MFRDYPIKKRDDIYQEDLPYIQDPYWTCHKLEQLQLEENTSAWLEKLPDNASGFINFSFHSHAQTAYKDFLSSIKFGNLVALRKPFFGEEVLGVLASDDRLKNGLPIGLQNRLGYVMSNQVCRPVLSYHKPTDRKEPEMSSPPQSTQTEPTACACNRDITLNEFLKFASPSKNTSLDTLKLYLQGFNENFSKYGMNTCREKAHFLAQCSHESGGFIYAKELGGEKKGYAPWYGRGLIQLTNEVNYRKYGADIGEDVFSNDENRNKVATYPHCVKSAFWFYMDFGKQNINKYAKKDDFNIVTAKTNGGFNGYIDRLQRFDKIVSVLKAEHLNQLRKPTGFSFEDSAIYNNKVYAHRWARYHDPLSKEQGTIKDKAEAVTAYKRALELYKEAKNEAMMKIIQAKIAKHE